MCLYMCLVCMWSCPFYTSSIGAIASETMREGTSLFLSSHEALESENLGILSYVALFGHSLLVFGLQKKTLGAASAE